MKVCRKTCLLHPNLLKLFAVIAYQKKGIFSINHGEIAYGIVKTLRAVQRTHTSNVPRSPLFGKKSSFDIRHWIFGEKNSLDIGHIG